VEPLRNKSKQNPRGSDFPFAPTPIAQWWKVWYLNMGDLHHHKNWYFSLRFTFIWDRIAWLTS